MKNLLFIVIDSVTNDVLFNKNNLICPFLSELRSKSITGDKMFSEAPYTEAALVSLLSGVDTLENNGHIEKLKNKKTFLEVLSENNYKVLFNNFYPSIYPKYFAPGFTDKFYIEGFNIMQLWEYRLKHYSNLFLNNKTTKKENIMLIDMLDDNFKAWIEYLELLNKKSYETIMINDCIDDKDLKESINIVKEEYKKFNLNKLDYLKQIFIEKTNHLLFNVNIYPMNDKIKDDDYRNYFLKEYKNIFRLIKKYNLKYNLKNNHLPLSKIKYLIENKQMHELKVLLASYKNSLFDKDIYDRINYQFDTFKYQRSFYTVSNTLIDWIDNNKQNKWAAYIHVDDAHFNENFFTYDTNDKKVVAKDFKYIKNYLKNIPKDYKGSITYDLSLLYCDRQVKRIYDYLDNEGLLDNTTIVITADHGFSYYYYPIREKILISNFKENYNVPFIVYNKNIKPKYINNFCATKDLPYTILDLMDLDIPKSFTGNSLLKFDGRDYTFLEYMGGGCPDLARKLIHLGVRTNNYEVFININVLDDFKDAIVVEIYDLKKDPNEYNNLKHKNIDISREMEILEKRFLKIKQQYLNWREK